MLILDEADTRKRRPLPDLIEATSSDVPLRLRRPRPPSS